ncbi:hypothetical protein PV325_010709 [Microctonus aethiopoides]|nr:hypothetical protein PV325_010709 [Microctonus aethiopoides]KAK0097572.1 hypothetical protein PV326_001079 [Microctonus aethiopoides]
MRQSQVRSTTVRSHPELFHSNHSGHTGSIFLNGHDRSASELIGTVKDEREIKRVVCGYNLQSTSIKRNVYNTIMYLYNIKKKEASDITQDKKRLTPLELT